MSSSTSQYRIISNLLRDGLPIPSPQCPSLCTALEFVPVKSNPQAGSVKLVSVYDD
ncbi:hypothetical protein P3S67_026301 [Capsicum chacoense]